MFTVNTGTSLVLSSLLSVLVFAGMQMFSKQLGSTEWLTILGGFLGSVLFICSLTVSSLSSCCVRFSYLYYSQIFILQYISWVHRF
uniref:Dolichyl-diphosphooligosaccharide--protein glycosyltransferase subunit KCP2 n=1 Tax=Cynoglossus semilaevis TaxID=244447 RepID=A0A3P8VAX8_CYNSE